ncbi:hypothetical protein JOQ06_018612, partial [Pogonophryne albipinna]
MAALWLTNQGSGAITGPNTVFKSSAIMYDAARVPSPKDGANGMAQPVLPGAGAAAGAGGPTPTAALQAKSEEGQP